MTWQTFGNFKRYHRNWKLTTDSYFSLVDRNLAARQTRQKPLLDIWEILSPLSRGTCWIIRRCGGPGKIEKPKEDDDLAWIWRCGGPVTKIPKNPDEILLPLFLTLRRTRDQRKIPVIPNGFDHLGLFLTLRRTRTFALQKNSLIFVTRLEDLPTHP